MQTNSNDLVLFVGDWSAAEQERIQRAVEAFEEQWRDSTDRSSAIDDSAWVVVQESPSWGPYYFAHRLGTRDSLTGRSARELASVLEETAQEL